MHMHCVVAFLRAPAQRRAAIVPRCGQYGVTTMGTGRLEAFSDGVIAIIITIMVLEMKVPHGVAYTALFELGPVFLSYVLSFVYIGIYWNNHHHLLHGAQRVSAGILWSNLHLLFWLSLMPFATGWMGENHFAALPTAVYGGVLLMCGAAYFLLARCIVVVHGTGSAIARAIGRDGKGVVSLVVYALAVGLALYDHAVMAGSLYVAVAALWLVPDRRIERELGGQMALRDGRE